MRDHDTVAYLDVLHAVTDGQYFPSSLVPDNARKLRLDRVEPAGNEQVAIVDGRVLNANEHLTRFGIARFRNLHEAKTLLRFTVLRQFDGLHQRLSVVRRFAPCQSPNLSKSTPARPFPTCCARPPSRSDPRSITANPSPLSRPLTSPLAPPSSPEIKMTRRPFPTFGSLARFEAYRVFKAFTTFAEGASSETISLDTRPFKSASSIEGRRKWLVASMRMR